MHLDQIHFPDLPHLPLPLLLVPLTFLNAPLLCSCHVCIWFHIWQEQFWLHPPNSISRPQIYHVSVSLNPCLSLSIYIPPSNSSLEKLLWLFVVLAFGLLMSFIINQYNNYTYLWAGHWQFLTVYLLFLYNSSRVILLAHSYILWPPDPA